MRHEIDAPNDWIDVRMGSRNVIVEEKQVWLEENIPETDWKMWASHAGGGRYGGGTTWYVSFKDKLGGYEFWNLFSQFETRKK